jgi:hypothetical protein
MGSTETAVGHCLILRGRNRRNQLAGNLSLRHGLEQIQMVNVLLREGALTQEFMERFGLETREPIQVRFLRMSPDLAESLDYPSKLSRNPGHIARLLADGEGQAGVFLETLDASEAALEAGAPVRVESVDDRAVAARV